MPASLEVGAEVRQAGVDADEAALLLVEEKELELRAGSPERRLEALVRLDETREVVARVVFRDFMGAAIDEDYRRLEWWTDRSTRTPGDPKPVVTYPAGALVVYEGVLYEALAENAEKRPNENPDVWKALPAPSDDVRRAAGSPHSAAGIRWPPPK